MAVKKISAKPQKKRKINNETLISLIVGIIENSLSFTEKERRSLINKTKNLKISAKDTFESVVKNKLGYLPELIKGRVITERYRFEPNFSAKVQELAGRK